MTRGARFENPVHVTYVEVVAATDKAILVYDRVRERAWVPRSQIFEWSDVGPQAKVGDEGDLHVTKWFSERIEWKG